MTRLLPFGVLAIALVAGTGAARLGDVAVPAGLSITIDDGAKQVDAHSSLSYKTVLSNDGAGAVSATVVIAVPSYAAIVKAGDGKVAGSTVTWPVTVQPGTKQAMTTSVTIGAIPHGQYNVTTLASVYLGDGVSGAPVIRSADSDRIPGVAYPAVAKQTAPVAADPANGVAWVFPTVLGVVALLVIGLVVVVVVNGQSHRRRRRRRA